MNLRFWLKENFRRRNLRWLSQAAARALFEKLRLPSLYPVLERVFLISRGVAGQEIVDEGLTRNTRELRVVSDERIRLDKDYVAWTAPLQLLPAKVTAEQMKKAIESLQKGKLFFPSQAYLEAVKQTQGIEVEFVHRCRVRSTIAPFGGNPSDPALPPPAVETEVFLLYDSPSRRAINGKAELRSTHDK
jgi:hypothetical protein